MNRTGCCTALLFAAAACGGGSAQTPLADDFAVASGGGFCRDGAWGPAPGKPARLRTFGSFCAAGDAATGTARSTTFPAPAKLTLYLAGYPGGKDLTLFAENAATGQRFAINPLRGPADNWRLYTFVLPSAWRGSPMDLTATDGATAVHGWLAFSEPVADGSIAAASAWGARDALLLLISAGVHFLLLALPALAASTWAAAKGLRNPVTLAAVALVAVAAAGYLAFWIYFFAPGLGPPYGAGLAIAAAIVSYRQFQRLQAEARQALGALLFPALLTGAAALLVLSTGFLYEGLSSPLETPARRFSHPLPPDNQIPFLFAGYLREGHVPRPMLGDWLSSDRPPLQTGMVLTQYAFTLRKALGYTVLSALLQSLWILGAWSVLRSLRVDRRAAALALGVTLFSGFVFLNTFFVWPKLLAAAFLLVLTAHLHEIEQGRVPPGKGAARVTGALAAFALLAHGGSAFGLLGLGFLAVIRGRLPALRQLGVPLLALVAIYLPWMLYQKLTDPPGDRLLKMHLAGVDLPDARPLSELLPAAYRAAGFSTALHNKVANLQPVYGNLAEYWGSCARLLSGSSRAGEFAARMRGMMFFEFLPALGLMALGLIALSIGLKPGRRSVEWSAAARIWLLIGCTDAVWVLLMFGPRTTVPHQGTYLTMILGFAGGVLALWAVSPWMAWTLGGFQIALSALLYLVLMRQPAPNGPLPEGAASVSLALVALGSLGAVAVILGRLAVAPRPKG